MNTETPDFADSTRPVITWYDSWRGRERTFRQQGCCVVCRRKTWAADDGENDPRGVLGDHAGSALIASEYDMAGPDVPLCFPCANDQDIYEVAVARSLLYWTTT